MSSPNLERAQLLLEQNRGKEAQEYASLAIQENPDLAEPYLYLSSALMQQDKEKEALDPITRALGIEPDNPYIHAQLARIHYSLENWKDAESTAKRSLELYPQNPDMFGLLAFLAARKANWKESLELAETGLGHDSDSVLCTNARANALSKLKRNDQAQDSLDYALSRDPENPYTHYQKGWTLLEAGKYDQAAKHFCEALRYDPDFEEAKGGLVQALKGKHFLYSLFLKYIVFMARLSSGAQMGIIFGGYFAQRILSQSLQSSGQPGAATAVRVIYAALVYFTWTASSLFNLLLFVHPMGRFALTERQKKVAMGVGTCVLMAIASLALYATTDIEGILLSAIAFAATTLPLSALEDVTKKGKFQTLLLIVVGQSICSIGAFILFLANRPEPASTLAVIAMVTGFAFTWLSSFFRS